ncbi:hypothetical protein V2J09_016768 [Rumex salicifolius]
MKKTMIRVSSHPLQPTHRARSVSVRCEQSAGNSVDVWLGRVAMVGFAVAISVEIATGKGLLENFGVASPLPTAALAVTALVGILTAECPLVHHLQSRCKLEISKSAVDYVVFFIAQKRVIVIS